MRLPRLAPYRLRIVFRGAFLLLVLATVGMALYLLNEEKQRSLKHYRHSILKTKDQIAARLRHPAGQLALLNPQAGSRHVVPVHPVVLPFPALDFDDRHKVQNAVEMSGCLIQYQDGGALCVAIGNNPWAGGFIYAAGRFASAKLVAHRMGDPALDQAHRLRVEVSLRGEHYRWIAPFELEAEASPGRSQDVRGRLTGFVETDGDYTRARPVKDFRGWLWQSPACASPAPAREDCPRVAFFSVRLPVDVLREALFQKERPQWPPADLEGIDVRVQVLAPGEGAPIFDSNHTEAVRPFSLADLASLLLPGERLTISQANQAEKPLVELTGSADIEEGSSPLLLRLIRRLPVEDAAPIGLTEQITTPAGVYALELTADVRSIDRSLAVVATRLSWFVGAMLAAILVAWFVIELGIIHRIGVLAKRTRALSSQVRTPEALEHFDLSDKRGADELGILATGLHELLQRVKEDVQRERIRAEQEKDMWHAVGHEIMSPLQSLMALHGSPEDPSGRYIARMQQALRILYGSASPSEAFQSSTLTLEELDLAAFLRHVADNAACVGIEAVRFDSPGGPIIVRADEHSLEDVVTHVLRNADRYRHAGTPITLALTASETSARISIMNLGPSIPEEMIERIFEYGVSDQPGAGAQGNRGQGLFVARTYMAKMGGTITAQNVEGGVEFELTLARMRAGTGR